MSRHTKGRGARTPHYHTPRPYHWSPRERQIFASWICERQMDNETQLIRLQMQQSRVVVQILDAEREETPHGSQNPPLLRSRRARNLLRRWDELDREIRCARHIEQLLAPIFFLAATAQNEEFISNDPMTLFFWGQCQKNYPNIAEIDLDIPHHKEVNSQ